MLITLLCKIKLETSDLKVTKAQWDCDSVRTLLEMHGPFHLRFLFKDVHPARFLDVDTSTALLILHSSESE